MPACSSTEISNHVTRYRSSSPPNSRSNSASPPLSWPIGPGSPPLSISPSNSPPTIVHFNRSMSNITNSTSPYRGKTGHEHQEQTLTGTIVDSTRNIKKLVEHQPKMDDHVKMENLSNRRTIFRGKHNETKNNQSGIMKTLFSPIRILTRYVNLVLNFFHRIHEILCYLVWAPIIWISAWICVFWIILQLPLNTLKWFIRVLHTSSSERSREKRCVLITGGSTIQALHLARNFYKAGARVIVCECDDLFGLARFSTACSRFYNVPRPGPGKAVEYVNALRRIVEREKVVYFIPTSSTSSGYYDALAKTHLEIMGCECFVPGPADVTNLEDPLELWRRCGNLGLARPAHRVIKCVEDVFELYEIGHITGNERHFMISGGPAGMTERVKLRLPCSIDGAVTQNLRRKLEQYDISETRPWIILRDEANTGNDVSSNGYQLVTCTTVKDSRIVANVTCRLDETRGLVPEERDDVERWLDTFLRGTWVKRLNGHLSFKLAYNDEQGLLPISCRVGVSLPYLCLTSVHPRLVWRPCRHFSRQNSANLVVNERYKKTISANHHQHQRSTSSDGLFASVRTTTRVQDNDSSKRLINERCGNNNGSRHFAVPSCPVLDKMDALFVYWDPLPYCAYYHLQFPFRRLAGVIRERPAQHKPPLAVVE